VSKLQIEAKLLIDMYVVGHMISSRQPCGTDMSKPSVSFLDAAQSVAAHKYPQVSVLWMPHASRAMEFPALSKALDFPTTAAASAHLRSPTLDC
jgi:hypothetical protein